MVNADSFDVVKWIRFAQEDYGGALVLSNQYRPHIELTCYHCQQAVEKILKAYIIAKEGSCSPTHDLGFLNNQCKKHEPDFGNFGQICTALKAYTVAGRYPQTIDIMAYQMKQALKDAHQILEFTKSKLKKMGYEYDPDKDIRIIC